MTKTPEELMEDWKTDRLKSGWYYTLTTTGDIFPNLWFNNEWNDFMGMVEKVLAPCDYSEYKSMQEQIAALKQWCEEFNVLDVAQENKRLRNLLKECKANIINRKMLLEDLDKLENPTSNLLTRINAALGKSEG